MPQAHFDSGRAKAVTHFLLAGHEVLTDFLQIVVQTSSERVPSVADLLHDRVFRRGLDFKVLRECRRVGIHGLNFR